MTRIEWCNPPDMGKGLSWNPFVGCRRKSSGCEHCYAERLAGTRLAHMPGYNALTVIGKDGPRWSGQARFFPDALNKVTPRQKPRFVFVNSMSDFFYPGAQDEWRDKTLARVALCPQHTFLILTKYLDEAIDYFKNLAFREEMIGIEAELVSGHYRHIWHTDYYGADARWPLPLKNLWIGASTENHETAEDRIHKLLRIPAALRFLSVEPMLGPINLNSIKWAEIPVNPDDYRRYGVPAPDRLWSCNDVLEYRAADSLNPEKPRVDWVICGAESGPDARPMDIEWARDLRDQCQNAMVMIPSAGESDDPKDWYENSPVPFYMKQLCVNGKKFPYDDWPDDIKIRQYPEAR